MYKNTLSFFFGVWSQTVPISDSYCVNCLFAHSHFVQHTIIMLTSGYTLSPFLTRDCSQLEHCSRDTHIKTLTTTRVIDYKCAQIFNPCSTASMVVTLFIMCSLSNQKTVPDSFPCQQKKITHLNDIILMYNVIYFLTQYMQFLKRVINLFLHFLHLTAE